MTIEVKIHHGSPGAARVVNLPLPERAKAARRLLGITRRNAGGLDRVSTMRRHLLIWILRADGTATVTEIARLAGVTHSTVVKVLGSMPAFPGPRWHADAMRDSDTEMMLRWVGTLAREDGTKIDFRTMLPRVYAELRTDGWPWRRTGRVGNRGNRKARA